MHGSLGGKGGHLTFIKAKSRDKNMYEGDGGKTRKKKRKLSLNGLNRWNKSDNDEIVHPIESLHQTRQPCAPNVKERQKDSKLTIICFFLLNVAVWC